MHEISDQIPAQQEGVVTTYKHLVVVAVVPPKILPRMLYYEIPYSCREGGDYWKMRNRSG